MIPSGWPAVEGCWRECRQTWGPSSHRRSCHPEISGFSITNQFYFQSCKKVASFQIVVLFRFGPEKLGRCKKHLNNSTFLFKLVAYFITLQFNLSNHNKSIFYLKNGPVFFYFFFLKCWWNWDQWPKAAAHEGHACGQKSESHWDDFRDGCFTFLWDSSEAGKLWSTRNNFTIVI